MADRDERVQRAVEYVLCELDADDFRAKTKEHAPVVLRQFLKEKMELSDSESSEVMRLTGFGSEKVEAPAPGEETPPQPADQPAHVVAEPPRATAHPMAMMSASAAAGAEVAAATGNASTRRAPPLVPAAAKPWVPPPMPLSDFRRGKIGYDPRDRRGQEAQRTYAAGLGTLGIAPAPATASNGSAAAAVVPSIPRHSLGESDLTASVKASLQSGRRSQTSHRRTRPQWGNDGGAAACLGLGGAFSPKSRTATVTFAGAPRTAAGSSRPRRNIEQRFFVGNHTTPAAPPTDDGGSTVWYGLDGKFSTEQSLYRPRPDVVRYNNLGQYHKSGMDPAAACITAGLGYATTWPQRPPPKQPAGGWHHDPMAPARIPPGTAPSASYGGDGEGGWHNTLQRDVPFGRAGRKKPQWMDQNRQGDAMTSIFGPERRQPAPGRLPSLSQQPSHGSVGQAPRSSILASRAGGRGDLTASSLKPSQVNPLEMATAQEAAMAERFGLHMSLGVK